MSRYRNIKKWKPGRNKERTSYVKYKDCKLDIKVNTRRIDGKIVKVLEILTILRESRNNNYFINPAIKRTGFMAEMMDEIEMHVIVEDIADAIWMDTVVNEFLPKWLEKRGYSRYPGIFGTDIYNYCKIL